MKDYYLILELTPDATAEDIKAAYRDKMRFYHPDRWRDDPEMHRRAEERAKELNEAYQALSNPTRRKQYDRERYPAPVPPVHVWAQPEPPVRYRTSPTPQPPKPAPPRRQPRRRPVRAQSLMMGLALIALGIASLIWLVWGRARENSPATPVATVASLLPEVATGKPSDTAAPTLPSLPELSLLKSLALADWCNQSPVCEGEGDATALEWSPDGSQLAILYTNRAVAVWNVAAQKTAVLLTNVCPQKASVINTWRTLAWSPDGAFLAVGGDRDPVAGPADTLVIWDTGKWAPAQCLDADNVDSLAWSSDSQIVARSGAFNTVQIVAWNVIDGSKVLELNAEGRGRFVRWSKGGTFMAYDNAAQIVFRDVAAGVEIEPIDQPWATGGPGEPTGLAWSPNGDYVAITVDDKALYVMVWGTQGMMFQTAFPNIRQVAWKPDSSALALAGSSDLIMIDVPSGSTRKQSFAPAPFADGPTSVDFVAWSPDGRILAAIVRQDSHADIWLWSVQP